MGVFCEIFKFGSTAPLNCCTGQNKGRYRKKKSSYCYSSRCFRSWENILIQCAALMDWRRPRPQLNLEGWRTVPIGNRTGHANLRAIIRLFFSLQLVTTQMTSSLSKNLFDMKQMLMKYKMFNRYLCSTSEVSSVCWHSHDTLSYHLVII